MARGKRSRVISIFFFFFSFLLGYPAEPLRGSEALYGREVGRLGCRKAPIVTNIVWILGSSKYTDTDICQIPF